MEYGHKKDKQYIKFIQTKYQSIRFGSNILCLLDGGILVEWGLVYEQMDDEIMISK